MSGQSFSLYYYINTGIYFSSLFRDPINDIGFVYGIRALFHALDGAKEMLYDLFMLYNEQYEEMV